MTKRSSPEPRLATLFFEQQAVLPWRLTIGPGFDQFYIIFVSNIKQQSDISNLHNRKAPEYKHCFMNHLILPPAVSPELNEVRQHPWHKKHIVDKAVDHCFLENLFALVTLPPIG